MRKFLSGFILLGFFVVAGCDLQPKIASIPDSIGDFISERYPTLLAEPDSEIYQTAVADYGVYASPTMYGNGDVTGEDYVLYSPVDDYMMPSQDEESDVEEESEDEEENDVEEEVEEDNDEEEESGYAPDTDVPDLIIPDYVNEKPVVPETKDVKPEPKQEPKEEPKSEPKKETENKSESDDEDLVRAPLREITIEKGDTLYSVSRKYSVPVNDLAVMNKIGAPFTLSVGQKLKVPDILSVPQYKAEPQVARTAEKKATVVKVEDKKEVKKAEQPKKDTEKKSAPVADAKKTTPAPEQKVNTQTKNADTQKTAKKVEEKKTDVKKETKKTDVKKQDTTKKSEAKKTDSKKTDAKKTASKDTTKKSDVKKTETKKTAQKKTQSTKQRTAQKMVARSSSKFSWPVRGKILSGYGSKSNGLFNDGINIKASKGTAVLAAENGFVAYAGNEVKGMGNLVIIQHADGWMTVYAHMDSMSVKRGNGVTVGQKIGTVGTSGKVDQSQLHFEIRKGTKAYNPINYLKK